MQEALHQFFQDILVWHFSTWNFVLCSINAYQLIKKHVPDIFWQTVMDSLKCA